MIIEVMMSKQVENVCQIKIHRNNFSDTSKIVILDLGPEH